MGVCTIMDRRTKGLTSFRKLSVIDKTLRILNLYEEPETILQRAIDYLINGAKIADIGIVWRYEPSSTSFTAQAVSGIDAGALSAVKVSSTGGIIGRVFQTGKRVLYPEDRNAPCAEAVDLALFGAGMRCLANHVSAACIPLSIKEFRYGVLMFLADRFTQSHTGFFQILAGLLAMNMEKADLVKELKDKEVSDSINRYKAALIPTLSHEMRTPLISIKGYSTALLMEDAVFTPERQREFLEIIDRESDTLEGLINEYLESSTIDAGTMKISLQPVRLPHLAAKVAAEIGHRFPRLSLIVDFPTKFPLIDADPERILQVLRQLLDNAAKYSPKVGMIVLQGRIEEKKAIISVADEGVGIAPEDLTHLFDMFFRAKSNSGTKILGTGLGLPISKAIIEAHGGAIWAESEPERGSRFYFTLPLRPRGQNQQDERAPLSKKKY